MKNEKLTPRILKKIKPENIVYAEFAEGGAMGFPGTARIFTLDEQTLHFYLVDLNDKNSEEDVHAYADAYTFLRNLEKQKILVYSYGGYGNHAWKGKNLVFSRDDDNSKFIYKKGKDAYAVSPSVSGVYFHIVANFATRPASIKTLAKFRDYLFKKSTPEEVAFYDAYLEQIRRIDNGYSHFLFYAEDYWNAVIYLRALNSEAFNLSDNQTSAGIKALGKYRLSALVKMIGWNSLDDLVAKLLEQKNANLFQEINKFVKTRSSDFEINNLFSKVRSISSKNTSLNITDNDCIANLFDQPVLVKFDDAANQEIMRRIIKYSGTDIRDHAFAISFYIANYIFNEDTLSYADILPVCIHIIEELPNDDPNNNKTDQLFWLASEVIDRVWRYSSENKITQKKCRDLVFGLFSARVGGLWPIDHYGEFEFKEHTTDVIFRESVSFVMSLNDISMRNEQLKKYFALYEKGYSYPLEPVARRAFFEHLKKFNTPKAQFEKILEIRAAQEYPNYLSYPETTKEADLVLEELFRTDEGARITGIIRLATFEQVLLSGKTMGVGVYILNYIIKYFDDFVNIIASDCKATKLDLLDVVVSLYTAAASGVTEENELLPLKNLANKIIAYASDFEGTTNSVTYTVEAALRYAKKHRRTILFQRSALQKIF